MFPVIQWAVKNARGLRYSYCVPLATGAFAMIFALYLNLVPAARNQVDPVHEDRTRRREKRVLARQNSAARTNSTAQKFGLAGIMARHRKQKDMPTAEHVERPRPEPMSPVKGEKDEIVQMSAPSGLIGDLKPWPGNTGEEVGESSSSNRSGERPDPGPTRHRPVWDDKDEDDFDDYHAVIAKGVKKR